MASPVPRGLRQVLQKSPSDIVILSALRTPVTRAKKGGFKDAYPEELLTHILKATLEANPKLDPALIDDVAIGSVLQELGGAKAGRMAQIHAGFPHSVPFHTINRQCSSGLAAITAIGNGIRAGALNVGVGGGMESMTRNYGSRAIPTVLWPELKESPSKDARDCIMPMGITSENVAARYGISRADQDAFAAESHKKASAAQNAGLFDAEIVPVKTLSFDPENPDAAPKEVTVTKDDGIRHNISAEKMATLKPAFKADGTSTAGNSSQVSDGAAAALLMRRSTATELGLTASIQARWVGTAVAGCAPDEMGVGPAVAIPKLLELVGMNVSDVGIWEINEAFASQALYSVRKLGIDEAKVNPKGGAIAIGHPLGATGARQLATLLPELHRTGQDVGVVSMCIGTGMGMAGMFVREQDVRPRPVVVRQFLRNASNAAPLTERVRRKIWGTDNPPGLKDPYGGEGVLERKWKKQPGQQEEEPARGSTEALESQSEDVLPDTYEPATTWEGLPRVGHLGKWSDLPPTEADVFNPFMLKKKLTKEGHLNLAAHQAAVELCLMHALKKPLTKICDVVEHEKPVFKMIWKCKIEPNAESQWGQSLVYPDDEAKDVLVYIFEQIGEGADTTAAPAEEEVQEDVETEEYEETVEDSISQAAAPPFFGYRSVQDKGFLSLSLNDPETKFAFLKRLSQLSGHYFPDPVMHSISTVQQAVEYLEGVVNPKPTKLADQLANNPELQHLPNVKLFTKRQTALHKDEELGRKKIIESELRARGLVE
ncbi:hypothetical protein CNMCM5623_001539 [Aspergillus felis]|uniref:Large ribosomal subunit protein mL50 n=1 Tax=Aspergillus felis TaxID=1287682 RepID=A0A8H6Q9W0_9EURO|nr:hypothetical protein CNMCM5623_001539 [Aspergillus felis]